jgi:hypothetical protein
LLLGRAILQHDATICYNKAYVDCRDTCRLPARGLQSSIWHPKRQIVENSLMSAAPRIATEEANDLPTDIVELTQLIGTLSAADRMRIEPVLARVIDSTKRRRRILSLVQDALSQLRLDMKYLVFDLEATRRERDAYRQRLGGNESAEGERFDGDSDHPGDE